MKNNSCYSIDVFLGIEMVKPDIGNTLGHLSTLALKIQ